MRKFYLISSSLLFAGLGFISAQTTTFNYTGAVQTYTVPICATKVTVTVAGAAGGEGVESSNSAYDIGGLGGSVTGVLNVVGGSTLYIYVGGEGVTSTSSFDGGGWNGGGGAYYYSGGYFGGGGGGASDIRVVGNTLADRVVVGGGGGGGGFNYFACCNYDEGGPGGAATGGCGYSDLIQCDNGYPGSGGTQAAGGAGGTYAGFCTANSGTLGNGGSDCTSSENSGAGGGGGYYGGGGGVWAGGGGGSNYVGGLATVTTNAQGTQSANGIVTITPNSGASSLTLTTSQVNPSCNSNNGTATVNVTGGSTPYTYTWAPGGQTNATATGLSGGTYTVTVTDPCGDNGTISVTLPTNVLTITASETTEVKCNGNSTGSATATVTSGTTPYTYAWAPGGQTNAVATGLSAGTYTVTVTSPGGCSETASVSITQPTSVLAISIASSTNVLCFGGSTGSATANAATGGTSPYTYAWTPSGGTNLAASNLSAGSYTITATDNNGCTATATTTITQPATGILIAIATQTNELCNGGSTGSITANAASGGTSPYTYVWSPTGGSNLTASNLSAGSYTITVTDHSGCSATASAAITQPNAMAITIATVNNVQCSGGNGSATANAATGGTSPYTYNWTPSGGTNLTASNLSAGTYTITAKDINGCSATASVTISEPANGLAINLATITDVTCSGGANGSITANTATGGTSPYTYNWTPSGGTNLTASNLSAGTYTLTVTDNNGCSVTIPGIVSGPVSPLTINIVAQGNVSCFGGSNGYASINNATGGTSPYTYLWSPTGGNNLTASTLSAGSYTITVTDSSGCTASASAMITQPATGVSVSIVAQTNILCVSNSGSATINPATGGTSPYVYQWSPTGGTNLTASGLSAGTYTIVATDNNGCTGSASVTITQGASTLSIGIASKTTLACEGMGYISAHSASGGTPPYTYSWTPSGGTNLTTITTLGAGTYTITAMDSTGCSATASETITLPAHLGVSVAGNNVSGCYGENTGSATATPTGGTSPYTYVWTPTGSSNATITGLTAGTYSVSITDSNGCTALDVITITQPTGMVVTSDTVNDVTIEGGGCSGIAAVTVVSGGTAPFTYLWSSGGQTTDTIKGQCEGLYCCTVTDANGCAQTNCIQIINVTGIATITGASGVNIFPNPSTGQFTVSGLEKDMTVEMYDYTGRKISSQLTIDNSQLTMNITDQPNGVYFIRILNKDGALAAEKKIVKTN